MRVRTRHPRLAAAACTAYGLAIWLYPSDFKRDFGGELAITFRNRVEDVLDSGSILEWLAFAVHIVIDWVRTCCMLATESRNEGSSVSLLGLGAAGSAHGSLDRAMDVSFVFAALGYVLAVVGWYVYAVTLTHFLR